VFPNPHASDSHDYKTGQYKLIVQISTDGFAAYPEAADLAFGPYAKFGPIIKDYRTFRTLPNSGRSCTGVSVVL
jgi:hypothetical protein